MNAMNEPDCEYECTACGFLLDDECWFVNKLEEDGGVVCCVFCGRPAEERKE